MRLLPWWSTPMDYLLLMTMDYPAAAGKLLPEPNAGRQLCDWRIDFLEEWKELALFCQRGLKVLKLLQLNKEKVWHINAFLADLVPPTMWIQSVRIEVMTFRGKLILIAKDFPFQCCSAESFPISKWISDISDRVKFLKWDEFVSIEFISTEHFF